MAVQAGSIALAADVAPLADPTNVIVGIVSLASVSGGSVSSATIVFPQPLTGTSFVCHVSANSGVPFINATNAQLGTTPGASGGVGEVTYSSISATGVTINMYRAGTTSTSISYRVEGF